MRKTLYLKFLLALSLLHMRSHRAAGDFVHSQPFCLEKPMDHVMERRNLRMLYLPAFLRYRQLRGIPFLSSSNRHSHPVYTDSSGHIRFLFYLCHLLYRYTKIHFPERCRTNIRLRVDGIPGIFVSGTVFLLSPAIHPADVLYLYSNDL